jgi:uric acid-xanthine permease
MLTTCLFWPRILDEPLPILLAAIMGLQHCFAMVGGLITPPLIVFRFAICGFPFCPPLEQYAISASLLISGVSTLINVTQFKLPYSDKFFSRPIFLGSGLLSVMGTSFTFLPIFEIAITQMKNEGIDGSIAYGKLLGTSMICSMLELGISFLPINTIKNMFPPLVTAITVMLIGVTLIGSGMKVCSGVLTVDCIYDSSIVLLKQQCRRLHLILPCCLLLGYCFSS